MAEYKLTYFNNKGLAEPIRFILALAGAEFEDIRIEKDQWPNQKQKFTWGQVPFLEFGDKQLAQSNTIARYLANKYKLAGNDEFEAAKCDEMVDALCDLRKEFFKVHFENDETKKAEFKKAFLETQVPKYFGKYNSIIEANGGKWLVGQNPSWADLQVATAVELFEVVLDPVVFDSYPAVKQLKESVFALPQIKTWIEKRPKTEL